MNPVLLLMPPRQLSCRLFPMKAPPPMSLNALQRAELRRACTTVLPGYLSLSPAEEFAALAEWCRARGVQADTYGQGGLLAEFEREVAALLGKPAACFMPSGVMAR